MTRGEGTTLLVAGKPYVWTLNDTGHLEAVSLTRLAEAKELLQQTHPERTPT